MVTERSKDLLRHQPARQWQVGDCRVDLDRQLVLREGRTVEIRPKAWDLLCLLLRRPNALVRSDHLIEALWPRQEVLPKALVNLVSELRGRLGEATVLQAVPRRGYLLQATPAGQEPTSGPGSALSPQVSPGARSLVGRHHELGRWRVLAAEARSQGLRLLALQGQAGVGKTTLVRQGAAELRQAGWTVLAGQCVEMSGEREPLAPLLQAVHEWARGAGDDALQLLERCAPCWLALLPGLMDAERGSRLRAELAEAGSARIGREAVALLQQLEAAAPVALILEDLHWADASTLDLLQALLPAVSRVRLLVILSWRSQELPPGLAALLSRLDAAPLSSVAQQFRLQCFSSAEVAEYVERRLPALPLSMAECAELARLTEGLPLFLKLLCDDHQAPLARNGRPGEPPTAKDLASRLRAHVHERVARLPSESRWLMELASCMTVPAPLPLLAQVLESSEGTVLDWCRALEVHGLFEKGAADCLWPGARVVPAYGPSHALFREAVVERLMPDLRQALNRRIALALQGAVDVPGSLLGVQLVQACVGAGMHAEAAQALQDNSSRWIGRIARGPAVRTLTDALNLLADTDASQAEAVKLRVAVCRRIAQLQPFDFRHDNTLHRRVSALWLSDTSGRDDAEGRWQHALAACMLHLNEGRADLARPHVLALLEAAQTLRPDQRSTAQVCRAYLAFSMGDFPHLLQAVNEALSLLGDLQGTPEWSPWIGMLQLQAARALACSGQLAQFRARLEKFLAPGPHRQTPFLLSFGSALLADALLQLGCHDAAALLFRTVLESGKEHEVEEGLDDAWLGLLACQPASQRPLQALREFVATIPQRGPSRGDHDARLLTADALIARSQWNDAELELDAAADIAAHWPLLHTERLRLKGRVDMGKGRPVAAQSLWQQALDIDIEKRNFAGALRSTELLGQLRPADKSAVLRCNLAFPGWLDAPLAGDTFAPLAQVQRRHRAVLQQT